MKPVTFPESNIVWAEDQKPYLPLPAYTNDRETITRWKLTWRERWQVFLTGGIWLRQCNFTERLQPQSAQVESPFLSGRSSKENIDKAMDRLHHA